MLYVVQISIAQLDANPEIEVGARNSVRLAYDPDATETSEVNHAHAAYVGDAGLSEMNKTRYFRHKALCVVHSVLKKEGCVNM